MSADPALPLADVVLSASPGSPQARERLLFVGFDDWQRAHQQLCWIAGEDEAARLFRKCLPTLLQVLADSPHPDQVLTYLERLASVVPDRTEFFRTFLERPRGWEILGRLFSGSQFLSEILLANPAYLDPLTRQRTLSEIKSVQQLYEEARAQLTGLTSEADRWDALRRHQRWEMLRIGVCDFFGLLDLRRVTVQLSLLADGLIANALDLAANTPGPDGVSPDPSRPVLHRAGFVVVALGKLGGEELNYSSDIDLLFLSGAGHPDHTRIGQRLIKILTAATGNGFLYRVDMRLRPWGRAGELVPTLEGYVDYLEQTARIWEKQALLKARVVAGDRTVGTQFLDRVSQRIFGESPAAVRDEIRRMKERIEGDLRKQGKDWGEVKLGRGSIRDVEFVTQSLQLVHGGRVKDARSFNTLDALVRLADLGFLLADEYRMLSDAYVFLRTIEHALQLRHNKQTHELPRDPAELMSLARRLDFGSDAQFLDHYRRHRDATRKVFDRYLGEGDTGRLASSAIEPAATDTPTAPIAPAPRALSPRTQRHLSRLVATYERAFPPADIDRHAVLAESLTPDEPVVVEAKPLEDGAWRLTIVGYDFHGALSLITGLLLAHGCNIVDGQVFTYDPVIEISPPTPLPPNRESRPPSSEQRSTLSRRQSRRDPPHPEHSGDHGSRIVDVFTVRPALAATGPELWKHYEEELRGLAELARQGRVEDAHGRLVKRVAATLRTSVVAPPSALYPIEIAVDNEMSDRFTVLIIRGRDTLGFLYELASALAQAGVSISRLQVGYALGDACDTIHVTDRQGQKIVDPDRRRELQATIVLIKHFTHLLPQSPDPEGALVRFREFLARLFQRPNWPDEVADLERPEVLRALARLLGVSDFLWNDFLRMQHENLFPLVRDVDALASRKSPIQLEAELRDWLTAAGPQWRTALNDYRDREMFRVDMRQILGHTEDFVRFCEELTDVADATVRAALSRCVAELTAQYGQPILAEGEPCRLAVCTLGKSGGREMGFASDIELMFLFEGRGRTSVESIRNEQFCVKLVDSFLHTLKSRREGVFEIDLRLRPHGRAGSLAVSLDSFREYFAPHGAAWPFERQALVKLRPVWGDPAFGTLIEQARDELIYTGEPFDTIAMRGMRERQLRQLVAPGHFHAKLGPGGLVDIEYLVQGLQITHGANSPALRSTNTLAALDALATANVVPPDDARDLREAFLFLRELIGAMRMVRGNARELSVPDSRSEECAFLCRRLGHDDPSRLHADLERHTNRVREINQRLLG
jgi:[glutamine synthetase] adenylyltransferase / [glutamine synthetase]-adenylyl-L-tyrosine phosphorylase